MTTIRRELRSWTADEVAECLSVSDSLYRKLWQIQNGAKNPTPMGGDGNDGTVETPDQRLDPANDDKVPHWWAQLTKAEQNEVNEAWNYGPLGGEG